MDIEFKCEKCGKGYTTEQYLKLEQIKAVKSDKEPMQQHGYISKCKCGYEFIRDKTRLIEDIEIEKGVEIRVSTVFLELNHWGYWYETMLFVGEQKKYEELEIDWMKRYKTLEEAQEGHKEIIKILKTGNHEINPISWKIELTANPTAPPLETKGGEEGGTN